MTLDLGTADQLRGALATVAAIPVTPFGPDGQADWDAHDRVIRRTVDAGVRLITPNGNTGEFYALTAAEARRATESAVAAAAESGTERPADVLAGVGHDLPGAIEAGRRARDNGVRMIMVHQPVGGENR
jgi:4-hydroxy-tetrahydrodipicolinate synthase